MAFFDEQQLAELSIEQMVFHLLGRGENNFVRLEAINPGQFSDFFIERIKSVNGGIPYEFSDASATRERLFRISTNPLLFQIESEKLAEDFQRRHGGSAAPGAFLVFQLRAAGEEVFALLKYDDETVLSYDVQDAQNGRSRVSLESIERTFVKNKDALQKSALIKLNEDGGQLTVLDRRNQQKIARYFEVFLDARRLHDDEELTKKLVTVVRELVRSNRELVLPEVYRDITRRTYEAALAGGRLDVDDQKRFLEAVIGQNLPDESPLVLKYKSALRKARIENTPVLLNAANVSPPSIYRYETINRIQIKVPAEMRRVVQVEEDRIIINDRLDQRYDDTERDR